MSRSNQTQATPLIRGMRYVLPFGKYQGWSIEMVVNKDPQYLLWMHNNGLVELDHIVYDECEEALHKTEIESRFARIDSKRPSRTGHGTEK